jgi:cystathionine beta-lyase/cystathionine gamma-synthase
VEVVTCLLGDKDAPITFWLCLSNFSRANDFSAVVSSQSPHYGTIKSSLKTIYEDTLCPLDGITPQSNCIDVVWRLQSANDNALAVVDRVARHPSVAQVHHHSTALTAPFSNRHRRLRGGYGQAMSVVFRKRRSASVFYDALDM